jgi:hypothetical protein
VQGPSGVFAALPLLCSVIAIIYQPAFFHEPNQAKPRDLAPGCRTAIALLLAQGHTSLLPLYFRGNLLCFSAIEALLHTGIGFSEQATGIHSQQNYYHIYLASSHRQPLTICVWNLMFFRIPASNCSCGGLN